MLEYRYDTQLLIDGHDLDEDKIYDYFVDNFEGDCLIAVGEEARINAGHIVKKVACQRHHAELQLHGARIMGKAAGQRRDIVQQGSQQRRSAAPCLQFPHIHTSL